MQNCSFISDLVCTPLVKTRVIAATAIVALLLAGVATVAFAHQGLLGPNNASNSTNSQGESDDNDEGNQTANQLEDNQGGLNLTVGQNLTFSGLMGHFNNLTNESSEDDDHDNSAAGNATGSFTFRVTGASEHGFNLTITAGSFTINSTTYTVTGGNLTLNEDGESGSGSGTATGGATFTIHVAGIHGNISSDAEVGVIKLDVKIGTSVYHVILGTPESEEDSSD